MDILLLKLLLAPIIIGSASLVGRRWGAAVSGWLVALPLTSGPVALILALSHGTPFVLDALRGTMSGTFSLVAYALIYALSSKRFSWMPSIILSVTTFFACTAALRKLSLALLPLYLSANIAIAIGLWLLPKYDVRFVPAAPARWDLPARMLLATSFILLITAIAPFIGARLTGLLTTIPLFVSILTVFAHRQLGADGAFSVLHGLLLGLFSFTAFYLVLGLTLARFGIAAAFASALIAALCIQSLSLVVLNRRGASH